MPNLANPQVVTAAGPTTALYDLVSRNNSEDTWYKNVDCYTGQLPVANAATGGIDIQNADVAANVAKVEGWFQDFYRQSNAQKKREILFTHWAGASGDRYTIAASALACIANPSLRLTVRILVHAKLGAGQGTNVRDNNNSAAKSAKELSDYYKSIIGDLNVAVLFCTPRTGIVFARRNPMLYTNARTGVCTKSAPGAYSVYFTAGTRLAAYVAGLPRSPIPGRMMDDLCARSVPALNQADVQTAFENFFKVQYGKLAEGVIAAGGQNINSFNNFIDGLEAKLNQYNQMPAPRVAANPVVHQNFQGNIDALIQEAEFTFIWIKSEYKRNSAGAITGANRDARSKRYHFISKEAVISLIEASIQSRRIPVLLGDKKAQNNLGSADTQAAQTPRWLMRQKWTDISSLAVNLTEYWTDAAFPGNPPVAAVPYNNIPSRKRQWLFLCALQKARWEIVQVGMRSGALEQGALTGLKTIYFEEAKNLQAERMEKLMKTLQNFRRMVVAHPFGRNDSGYDPASGSGKKKQAFDADAKAALFRNTGSQSLNPAVNPKIVDIQQMLRLFSPTFEPYEIFFLTKILGKTLQGYSGFHQNLFTNPFTSTAAGPGDIAGPPDTQRPGGQVARYYGAVRPFSLDSSNVTLEVQQATVPRPSITASPVDHFRSSQGLVIT